MASNREDVPPQAAEGIPLGEIEKERSPLAPQSSLPTYGSSASSSGDGAEGQGEGGGTAGGGGGVGQRPGRVQKWRATVQEWKTTVQEWRANLGKSIEGALAKMLPCWKKRSLGTPPPPRTIHFLQPRLNKEKRFCSNKISTTKYNLLTFLPRFLFDQFRRYANLFFLFIAILQQIPDVSPTGRYTTIVPLSLVLLATAVKEIIEDYRRFRADNQVNYSKVEVLSGEAVAEGEVDWTKARWGKRRWTKVKVGDIVRVENGSFFPADLLLLSSSEEQGIAFVETSNLDGETNLKIRQAHPATSTLTLTTITDSADWRVECEGPNNRLYDFTGNLHLKSDVHSLQPDQILLRGAQLRNTAYVLGLVVYTGHDSKLLQNSTQAPLKRSRLDHITNTQVVAMFFFLIGLAVVSSICAAIINANSSKHWYLVLVTDSNGRFVAFLKSIITFIILYNNLIPISLIVTLEVVKFVQSFYINYDLDMYDPKTDTPALARNSNLNEELGQVKYVFSDKTGTLTENIMEFKKCSVGGKIYGMETVLSGLSNYQCLDMKQALRDSSSKDELTNFLLVLALCHSVIPEVGEEGVVYHASSPDEEALIKAARELGVFFKARTPEAVIVEVNGREQRYEILNLLEFNSVRKRMSVIVRTPGGVIKLLCKGADSVIYERMAGSQDDPLAVETGRHMEHFAVDGLRTLCVAERELEKGYYREWSERYQEASTSLTEREKKLDEVAEEIEKDLQLLGATAIEDKLQEGVPETIASLREAGMKVWILTGDKQETAINIGFSSRQLTNKMTLLIINGPTKEVVKQLLEEHVRTYLTPIHGVTKQSNGALIIDGKSLQFALQEDTRDLFLDLALVLKSVICCRVSPLQKAEVVRLVQQRCKKEVTLAIGDGANDVSMIQAAHVGVGISGREGLQATLASDYAIAQFRFLLKLLFVHGVWDYNRLANIILFSFYKNICLYIIEFWFAFFSGFSGQAIFERWTIGLFNVLFTSLGPFTLGFFEQDVSAQGRLSKPRLYKASQEGKYFNSWVFWKWVLLSLYHSIILFFIVYFILQVELPFSSGKVLGIWYVGNTVYTTVVIAVNLKLALETQYWPWLHHIAVWGSILVWFIFLAAYSHVWPTFPIAEVMVGIDRALYGSVIFYGICVLVPSLAMLPDLLKTIIQKVFYPTDVDKERLLEVKTKRVVGKYEAFEDSQFAVSYSSRDSMKYADGLEPEEEMTPLIVGRTRKINRGFAFAQEDHDDKNKGTFLQRRSLIRMFNTKKKGTFV